MDIEDIEKVVNQIFKEQKPVKRPQIRGGEGFFKECFKALQGKNWDEKKYDEDIFEMKKQMLSKKEYNRKTILGTVYYDGNYFYVDTK